jgi:hypothetical protein
MQVKNHTTDNPVCDENLISNKKLKLKGKNAIRIF